MKMPDELVQEIFDIRRAKDDEIEIDDLNIFITSGDLGVIELVVVSALDEPIGMGKTIQAALEDALAAVQK